MLALASRLPATCCICMLLITGTLHLYGIFGSHRTFAAGLAGAMRTSSVAAWTCRSSAGLIGFRFRSLGAGAGANRFVIAVTRGCNDTYTVRANDRQGIESDEPGPISSQHR